jgi:CxxC motif-containing protein (DUF1111 family)
VLLAGAFGGIQARLGAHDPGVRGGPPAAGEAIEGLTSGQEAFFEEGSDAFEEAETLEEGLGPRFNLDSCGGCHAQPALGGTSPAENPQVAAATAFGARNILPPFITPDGPVREARFKYTLEGSGSSGHSRNSGSSSSRALTPDGGVHALFVISGRNDGTADASGCGIVQDDFAAELARHNVIFRIPTPTFGLGLVEQIPDSAIVANQEANLAAKRAFGIHGQTSIVSTSGRGNRNGNDGTIARFGWKAQNKSLAIFSGEAYNVEMGITNELFQTEREEDPECQFAPTPNDVTGTDADDPLDAVNDADKFALFMRFLAPPEPSPDTPGGAESIGRGRQIFNSTGCALCHTPALQTGHSTVAALDDKPVNLYSDLLLHNMGTKLADDISQGVATGDEFRTAPLWGLGQRIFFLHDGRTTDLVEAILAHQSGRGRKYGPSEANKVIDRYNELSDSQQQDLLNFLRSL